jgi:hypothetical protein
MGNEYDTTIKDIAGIKDYSEIFRVLEAYFVDENSTEELIVTNNIFDIRTEKGREKVTWAVKNTILSFINDDHKSLLHSIFKKSNIPTLDKNFILLWQLCINNMLIRDITCNVFIKTYYSGRAAISSDDIIGYLKEKLNDPESSLQKDWAEETIYRIATKYLSLMTKLGFVSSGRVKTFEPVRMSREAQTLFLYFTKVISPHTSNLYTSEILPLLFIQKEDLLDRLKKLSMKGLFNISLSGTSLNVELIHPHTEICDVLYH